mmetsp:Transcript_42379/g.111544  ORF Transcript_42379/g.111544 Transcript_42379/m.111544 type:complete len:213 (-) Transcript_42379:4392-5030(-)
MARATIRASHRHRAVRPAPARVAEALAMSALPTSRAIRLARLDRCAVVAHEAGLTLADAACDTDAAPPALVGTAARGVEGNGLGSDGHRQLLLAATACIAWRAHACTFEAQAVHRAPIRAVVLTLTHDPTVAGRTDARRHTSGLRQADAVPRAVGRTGRDASDGQMGDGLVAGESAPPRRALARRATPWDGLAQAAARAVERARVGPKTVGP